MNVFKKEYLLSIFLLLMGISMLSRQGVAQTTEAETRAQVEAKSVAVLAGMVMDKASQKAISGAEVKIDGEVVATTNSRGEFVVEGLKQGLHEVTVEAEGYKSWKKEVSIAEKGKKIEVKLVSADQ